MKIENVSSENKKKEPGKAEAWFTTPVFSEKELLPLLNYGTVRFTIPQDSQTIPIQQQQEVWVRSDD